MKLWHSANLLFEARVGGVMPSDGLREESIRVLLAESEEETLNRAGQLGSGAEHQYTNDAGELVRWRFVELLEVQSLGEPELSDGSEAFATLLKATRG